MCGFWKLWSAFITTSICGIPRRFFPMATKLWHQRFLKCLKALWNTLYVCGTSITTSPPTARSSLLQTSFSKGLWRVGMAFAELQIPLNFRRNIRAFTPFIWTLTDEFPIIWSQKSGHVAKNGLSATPMSFCTSETPLLRATRMVIIK